MPTRAVLVLALFACGSPRVDTLEARVKELEAKLATAEETSATLQRTPDGLAALEAQHTKLRADHDELASLVAKTTADITALQSRAQVRPGSAMLVEVEVELPKDLSTEVPECDAYLRAYLGCLDKMPEAVRESMRNALEQTAKAWRSAAEIAGTRDALAKACERAQEVAGEALASFGCEF